jgi:hypothetical protein
VSAKSWARTEPNRLINKRALSKTTNDDNLIVAMWDLRREVVTVDRWRMREHFGVQVFGNRVIDDGVLRAESSPGLPFFVSVVWSPELGRYQPKVMVDRPRYRLIYGGKDREWSEECVQQLLAGNLRRLWTFFVDLGDYNELSDTEVPHS